MTYEERIAYILEIPKFTKKNELSHTREFLKRLGNPQEKFPVIHVAGSNGKGSVCAFLNRVLMENGVRVAMFTSPHLVDIRERFLILGQPCDRDAFLTAEEKVAEVVTKMQEEGLAHPTFFEYIFAVGMQIFADAGLECAVLETGLGGRLDATNVIEKPLLTIITSISLEHTEILGNTLAEIAAEKAGIIKQGVPLIYDGTEPEANAVIERIAKEKNVTSKKVDAERINILLNDGKKIDFSIKSGYDVTRVRIPFAAEYQVMNAALAFEAVQKLKEHFNFDANVILQAFANVEWAGRMEEVYPDVYLDGAHNLSGVKAFLNAVLTIAERPAVLLFSMVKEKDYKTVIRHICQTGNFSRIILTEITDNPRALSIEELQMYFEQERKESIELRMVRTPKEAFLQAIQEKEPGQKLFCAGSLYLIGELKKIVGGQNYD